MKLVCKFCGKDSLIKWGGRRKFCNNCKRSFRAKRKGRKSVRNRDMYLLDRSTYRRIGKKKKYSAVTIMEKVHLEIAPLPTPLSYLKKTSNLPLAFSSWTANT